MENITRQRETTSRREKHNYPDNQDDQPQTPHLGAQSTNEEAKKGFVDVLGNLPVTKSTFQKMDGQPVHSQPEHDQVVDMSNTPDPLSAPQDL